MTILCNQMISSISAIIFSENKYLSLSVSIITILLFKGFDNFLVRIIKMDSFSQISTNFSFFNSMLILIYGYNRCPNGQLSEILFEFQINDDLFERYAQNILIYNSILLLVEIIVFFIKTYKIFDNHLKIIYKFNILKKTNETSDEKRVSIELESIKNNIIECNDIIDSQLSIAWTDLSVDIQSNKFSNSKNNRILDNICGGFEGQTLNGVMGPSGSGKTTLINCLNGAYNKYLSKETKFYSNFPKISRNCYIRQNVCEHILIGMTVNQTLLYASKLKNSTVITELNHKLLVNELMSKLLISDIKNSCVETCSGGELKRIAIAAELTAYIKPNILYIDEPTSGLDSNAAQVVIDF